MSEIGTLNESPLHAALKEIYRRPGDDVEVPTEGFVADLRNGTSIIEIQTSGFSAMRKKFDTLLDRYQIHLVHPVTVSKWIVKLDSQGQQVSRRKSPKAGRATDLCRELASFPMLLSHPNFTLDLVLTSEDEIRSPHAKKKRRRGGLAVEYRELNEVLEVIEFRANSDLLQLLPTELVARQFNTKDVAEAARISTRETRDLIYCLKTAEVIQQIHRDASGIIYEVMG